MEIIAIIAIIFFIIVVTLIFKTVKKILLAFLLVNILLFILLAVFGFFIYSDFMNLKEGFTTKENLFVLHDQNIIIAGFSMKTDEQPKFLDDTSKLTQYFQKEEYSNMLQEHYKLVLFDIKTLESNMPDPLRIDEQRLKKQSVIDILKSQDPIDAYIDEITSGKGYSELQIQALRDSINYDESTFKAMLFAVAYSSIIQEKGPVFLLDEYKKGNIIIYPKTAIFKAIQFIPIKLINSSFQNIVKKR